jgi:hypothetical protein
LIDFERGYVLPEYFPEWVAPISLVTSFLAIIALNLVCVPLIFLMIRFTSEAIEVGLPAVVAALSVGPGVPRWVGHAESDTVIRLSAPLSIKTADFKPAEIHQRLAM